MHYYYGAKLCSRRVELGHRIYSRNEHILDVANVDANAPAETLLSVVVFVNLRRNVVHKLQDLLDDGLFARPDGTFHVRQLHTGISIDFRCNSFTAAHVLIMIKA